MRYLLSSAIAILFACFAISAYAQPVPASPNVNSAYDELQRDICNNILIASNNGTVETMFESKDDAIVHMTEYLCGKNEHRTEGESYNVTEREYLASYFRVKGYGHYDSTKHEKHLNDFRSEHCSEEQKNQVRQSGLNFSISVIDSDVLSAYQRCLDMVKPQPITCLVDTVGGHGVLEVINQTKYGAGPLIGMRLAGDNVEFDASAPLHFGMDYGTTTVEGKIFSYFFSPIELFHLQGDYGTRTHRTIKNSAIFNFHVKDIRKPAYVVFLAETLHGVDKTKNVSVSCGYNYYPRYYQATQEEKLLREYKKLSAELDRINKEDKEAKKQQI